MSEHSPYQNHNNESSRHESDSLSVDKSEYTQVSSEERTRLSEEAKNKHDQRNAEKSERIADALDTVHAQYDAAPTESNESAEAQRVVFNGEVVEVAETYTDGMGHTWVELTDGRHTMRFEAYSEPKEEAGQEPESVASSPSHETEKDKKVADALGDVHALYDNHGDMSPVEEVPSDEPATKEQPRQIEVFDPKNNPEHAKQLAEAIAEREAKEAARAAKKQAEADRASGATDMSEFEKSFAKDKASEPNEQIRESQTQHEQQLMQRRLRQIDKELHSIDVREQVKIRAAIDSLEGVVRGLSRNEGNNVEDTLHSSITTAINIASLEAQAALQDEHDRAKYLRQAEMAMGAFDSAHAHSDVSELRGFDINAGQGALKMTLTRLRNSDPRYFRQRKSEYIMLIRQSIRNLEDVQGMSAVDARRARTLVAA